MGSAMEFVQLGCVLISVPCFIFIFVKFDLCQKFGCGKVWTFFMSAHIVRSTNGVFLVSSDVFIHNDSRKENDIVSLPIQGHAIVE